MRALPLIALAIALAACGKQSSSGAPNAVAADGTAAATTPASDAGGANTGQRPTAASLGLQPGKWETRIAITQFEMNGVSRAAPAAGQSVKTCVTPELAAKGPNAVLRKAGVQCTVSSESYASGKMSARQTCKTPMGVMTTNMTGTYSPTAMTSDADTAMTGRMSMKEHIHSEMRRVGDCG